MKLQGRDPFHWTLGFGSPVHLLGRQALHDGLITMSAGLFGLWILGQPLLQLPRRLLLQEGGRGKVPQPQNVHREDQEDLLVRLGRTDWLNLNANDITTFNTVIPRFMAKLYFCMLYFDKHLLDSSF